MNANAEALMLAVAETETKVPAIGTRRRARALVRLGWPANRLATRAGLSTSTLHNVLTDRSAMCDRSVATAVDRLYRDLSMTPGPSPRAAARAAARGWVPPLAWDDNDGGEHDIDIPTATPTGAIDPSAAEEQYDKTWCDPVAVLRTCEGDRPARPLTRAETIEAIRRLAADGLTYNRIQRTLGLSGSNFQRYRAAAHSSSSQQETAA